MKTTVDLPEVLVHEAQDVARAEGTTLRSLVEDGLRLALQRRRAGAHFRLPDASVAGNGLRPEFRGRRSSRPSVPPSARDRGRHQHPGLRSPAGFAVP